MKKIIVLIVDDSVLVRKLLTDILNDEPDIEVIATAQDPYDAREKIKALNPDVVTLDIEMPKMDGLSFLEKIMNLRPTPVVMISTLTQKGAGAALRALEIGAVDYISKPIKGDIQQGVAQVKKELPDKIRAAAMANLSSAHAKPQSSSEVFQLRRLPPAGTVVAVGSSTGGVEALRDIFRQLPKNAPPIVIAQHMPAQFTPSFAARLDSLSEVAVREARNGDVLLPGHAYLSPGGIHLKVVKKGRDLVCALDAAGPVSGHCPSVDVLFGSVAEAAGPSALGIILTGMGHDGAKGLLEMRRRGAYTIGQNQASSVVYGMPRVAHEMGAVEIQLPLNRIAEHIVGILDGRGC